MLLTTMKFCVLEIVIEKFSGQKGLQKNKTNFVGGGFNLAVLTIPLR